MKGAPVAGVAAALTRMSTPPSCGDDEPDHGRDRRVVAGVGRHADHLAPALPRHLLRGALEHVLGARDERHVGALGRQCPPDRESDAPTAGRDHGAARPVNSRSTRRRLSAVPCCHTAGACLV